MTHICVSKLTIIGSDNGLSPGRRQAIIWTNAGILLIGPLGTNFSEISVEILIFIQENALESVVCEMAAILSRPECVYIWWHVRCYWVEVWLASFNNSCRSIGLLTWHSAAAIMLLLISHQISKLKMFLVSSCSSLCTIYWNQVLSREWRCSWSSVDRRCSNNIWAIDNFVA